jgi:hypothetical protein
LILSRRPARKQDLLVQIIIPICIFDHGSPCSRTYQPPVKPVLSFEVFVHVVKNLVCLRARTFLFFPIYSLYYDRSLASNLTNRMRFLVKVVNRCQWCQNDKTSASNQNEIQKCVSMPLSWVYRITNMSNLLQTH